MTPTDKEKIERFLNDTVMSDAVYNVLLDSFLKRSKFQDVNYLAAARIAIDLLEDGWSDLKKLKTEEKREPKKLVQVGI